MNSSGISRSELLRKLAHIAAFWPALLLPWLSPLQAVGIALLLIILNMFVLPKMAPLLYRSHEPGKGQLEIILYPFALLATIVAFGFSSTWYLSVIAIWFGLAIGDAVMGFACRLFATNPKLPWNDRKSILGVVIGAIALGLIAYGVGFILEKYWFQNYPSPLRFHLSSWFILAVVVCALAETIWFGIADNLVIPFSLTIFLSLFPNPLFLTSISYTNQPHLLLWLALPFLFAVASYLLRLLTLGGAALGGGIALILILAHPALFFFMCGFFLLGNIATRIGFKAKLSKGIAESRGGQRGAAQVFGAMGIAAWITPLVYLTPNILVHYRHALLVCLAPLITKTMDTVSSEIGKAFGGRTYSLQTFKLVAPGTEGAVSLLGTGAGVTSALLLGLFVLPLVWGGIGDVAALIVIAVAGNLFESWWKIWSSRQGIEAGAHTNVLMTLISAVLAWLWWFGFVP